MDRKKRGLSMAEDRSKIKEQYLKKLKLVRAYNKEHYKAITIRLDYVKDADIINWLSNFKSNKKYICEVIRKDMNNYEEV